MASQQGRKLDHTKSAFQILRGRPPTPSKEGMQLLSQTFSASAADGSWESLKLPKLIYDYDNYIFDDAINGGSHTSENTEEVKEFCKTKFYLAGLEERQNNIRKYILKPILVAFCKYAKECCRRAPICIRFISFEDDNFLLTKYYGIFKEAFNNIFRDRLWEREISDPLSEMKKATDDERRDIDQKLVKTAKIMMTLSGFFNDGNALEFLCKQAEAYIATQGKLSKTLRKTFEEHLLQDPTKESLKEFIERQLAKLIPDAEARAKVTDAGVKTWEKISELFEKRFREVASRYPEGEQNEIKEKLAIIYSSIYNVFPPDLFTEEERTSFAHLDKESGSVAPDGHEWVSVLRFLQTAGEYLKNMSDKPVLWSTLIESRKVMVKLRDKLSNIDTRRYSQLVVFDPQKRLDVCENAQLFVDICKQAKAHCFSVEAVNNQERWEAYQRPQGGQGRTKETLKGIEALIAHLSDQEAPSSEANSRPTEQSEGKLSQTSWNAFKRKLTEKRSIATPEELKTLIETLLGKSVTNVEALNKVTGMYVEIWRRLSELNEVSKNVPKTAANEVPAPQQIAGSDPYDDLSSLIYRIIDLPDLFTEDERKRLIEWDKKILKGRINDIIVLLKDLRRFTGFVSDKTVLFIDQRDLYRKGVDDGCRRMANLLEKSHEHYKERIQHTLQDLWNAKSDGDLEKIFMKSVESFVNEASETYKTKVSDLWRLVKNQLSEKLAQITKDLLKDSFSRPIPNGDNEDWLLKEYLNDPHRKGCAEFLCALLLRHLEAMSKDHVELRCFVNATGSLGNQLCHPQLDEKYLGVVIGGMPRTHIELPTLCRYLLQNSWFVLDNKLKTLDAEPSQHHQAVQAGADGE